MAPPRSSPSAVITSAFHVCALCACACVSAEDMPDPFAFPQRSDLRDFSSASSVFTGRFASRRHKRSSSTHSPHAPPGTDRRCAGRTPRAAASQERAATPPHRPQHTQQLLAGGWAAAACCFLGGGGEGAAVRAGRVGARRVSIHRLALPASVCDVCATCAHTTHTQRRTALLCAAAVPRSAGRQRRLLGTVNLDIVNRGGKGKRQKHAKNLCVRISRSCMERINRTCKQAY